MLKNYIKIALRNIIRNRIFSFINIVGLAIGLAVSFCIIIYITHELSYDKHLENYDNIYRVDSHLDKREWRLPMTSLPLAVEAKNKIPGIKSFVRLRKGYDVTLKLDNNEFVFKDAYYSDPGLFNIFTFVFTHGSKEQALVDPNSIVLTEEAAIKCFGRTNVVGETIEVSEDTASAIVKITGVIKNEKSPATIVPDLLLPLKLRIRLFNSFKREDWVQVQRVMTYLMLNENASVKEVEKQLKIIHDDNTRDLPNYVEDVKFKVIPLSDTYFNYADYQMPSFLPVINSQNVYIYSGIAILILALGCINFIVLTSTKYSTRNIDIGIRKVIGARRRDIVKQLLTESTLTSLLALPISIFLIELIFPYFEEIINRHISSSFYNSIYFLLGFLIINLFIGFLSGIYTAYSSSIINPIEIFRKGMNNSGKKIHLKRALLSFQMIVFITLIISTIVLNDQLKLTHDMDLGYDLTNLLDVRTYRIDENAEAFKNSLDSCPGIIEMAYTLSTFPYTMGNRYPISKAEEPNTSFTFAVPLTGYKYPQLLKIELINGDFTSSSRKNKVLINETAARELEYENPIGKYLLLYGQIQMEIIGVVKDFNINSLREKIRPVVMKLGKYDGHLIVKYDPAQLSQTLNFIEKSWHEFTDEPLTTTFIDEKIDQMYSDDYRFSKAINFFTIVAIIIAAMGLFGVVLFSTQQRTKEIGIRKVLGASVPGIVHLVIYEFIIILIAAFIIAGPLSYYLMNLWLQDFAYRIDIGFGIYMLAATLAFLIIVSTVIIQAVRAARANPVESLKYE